MKCPSCGTEASGRFCSSCGSPLELVKCTSCDTRVPPGAKFCTGCGKAMKEGGGRGGTGAPVAGPTAGPGGNLGWWVAGLMLVLVVFALGYPALRGRAGSGAGSPVSQAPTEMGGPGSAPVDLTTMSTEEQATILFNRVMSSNSVGDTADVAFFLPKALTVHEQFSPSDPDGLYHWALLLLVDQDFEAALDRTLTGLGEVPDYLLLLAAGAEALIGLGDMEGARANYARFVEVYDTEMARMRPGYEHHTSILPVYLEEARAFLSQR